MLSLANIYTLYFRLYFWLCICLNKLSINEMNNSNEIILNENSILYSSKFNELIDIYKNECFNLSAKLGLEKENYITKLDKMGKIQTENGR